MNNIFYNYIDRLLPSCFFCLEEKVKTLLAQGDVSSSHSIDAEQCLFPDNYVVIPIENAVLPFYLTCIDRKYTFLLIDRHLKDVYCITKKLKVFLMRFRKPMDRQEISEHIQTYHDRVFLRESIAQGFLLPQRESCELPPSVISYNFPKSLYTVVEVLAQSTYSISYHVRSRTGQDLFLKQLRLIDPDQRKHFQKEISIIKRLQDSQNILKLICFDIESMYYVTEYIQGRNLEVCYHAMNFSEKIDIIKRIIAVIANLHSRNIVHGDLHLAQFIISDTGILKLIDYEMLGDITSKHVFPYMGATFEYIEPESLSTNPFVLIQKEDINFKAEVYRLGVLIYTIIYETPPFYEITWKMLCESILHESPTFVKTDNKGHRIPDWIIELIKKCLHKDPNQRYASVCEIENFGV